MAHSDITLGADNMPVEITRDRALNDLVYFINLEVFHRFATRIEPPISPQNTAKYLIEQKLLHYRYVNKELRHDATPEEARTLKFVRHEIGRLSTLLRRRRKTNNEQHEFQKQRAPSPEDETAFASIRHLLSEQKKIVVQSYNLYYLRKIFKERQFDTIEDAPILQALFFRLPKFTLNYPPDPKSNIHYQLGCSEIPHSKFYNFDTVIATSTTRKIELLTAEIVPLTCRFPIAENSVFPIHKLNKVQVGALMNGRAVFTELDAWMCVDEDILADPNNPRHSFPFNYFQVDIKQCLLDSPFRGKEDIDTAAAMIIENGRQGKPTPMEPYDNQQFTFAVYADSRTLEFRHVVLEPRMANKNDERINAARKIAAKKQPGAGRQQPQNKKDRPKKNHH